MRRPRPRRLRRPPRRRPPRLRRRRLRQRLRPPVRPRADRRARRADPFRAMPPVLPLVGRPNVGKSTLFNVLTASRDAIVADVPGLTRDRQYGFARLGPVPSIVIDTGGLVENPTGIEAQMRAQTERAVAEA